MTVPPSDVSISVVGMGSSINDITKVVTLIDGIPYTFTCDIFGAGKNANVTWILSVASTPTIPREEIYLAQPLDEDDCSVHQFDNKTFELTADMMEHKNQSLTCEAANSAGSLKAVVSLEIGKMECSLLKSVLNSIITSQQSISLINNTMIDLLFVTAPLMRLKYPRGKSL